MKKLFTLFLFISAFINAQTNITIQAPLANSNSQLRAPNGNSSQAGMKACYLIRQSELSALTGSLVNSIGFDLLNGTTSVPVSGNFTVYLQNTADVTYNKGTSYSGALVGMSAYCTTVMTIPVSTTGATITLNFTPTFTYTGGGIYVAFEWSSTGPFDASFATYNANYITSSSFGATSYSTGIPAVNTMTVSDYRPAFFFSAANTASNNISVLQISAPGKIAKLTNVGHVITAQIKNASNAPVSNIPVGISVVGANPLTSGLIVPILAAGQVTTVSFAPYNPQVIGLNNITVAVPNDENNSDNSLITTQSVTCNEVAIHPPAAAGVYTSQGYGAGASSSGIIYSFRYTALATSTLLGVRLVIPGFTNAANLGKQLYSVLQDNTGAIIATGNTITITAAMLDQFSTVGFPIQPILLAGQNYNLGIAMPTNGYYPVGNTFFSGPLFPPFVGYYSSSISGGPYTALNVGHLSLEGQLSFNFPISIAQSQSVTCGNTSFTLTATGASNYFWNANPGGALGSNSGTLIVTPTIPSGIITYTAVGTDPYNCAMGATTITHTVSAPPTVVINSSSTSYCMNQSGLLTASGANTYSWSTGVSAPSILIPNTVLGPITYTVLGINLAGCESVASIGIVVSPIPTVAIVPTNASICKGESITLIATGASNYIWTNTSSSSTISSSSTVALNPSSNTSYSVVGTDGNNCSSSSSLTLIVDPCTGIAMHTTINVEPHIFPNPSNGIFTIESVESAQVTIYNALGKLIYQEQISKGKNEFNLGNLKKGIYIITIETKNDLSNHKLIIE